MNRTRLNFWVDCLLLVEFLTLLWLSVVVRYVFPPAISAAGWTLWGYTYDSWSGFQFSLVATLALTVLLHVMLHWSWVCGVIASMGKRVVGSRRILADDGARTLLGVAVLIVALHLIGIGVALASVFIEGPTR